MGRWSIPSLPHFLLFTNLKTPPHYFWPQKALGNCQLDAQSRSQLLATQGPSQRGASKGPRSSNNARGQPGSPLPAYREIPNPKAALHECFSHAPQVCAHLLPWLWEGRSESGEQDRTQPRFLELILTIRRQPCVPGHFAHDPHSIITTSP